MAQDIRQGPLQVGDKFLKYVIQGLVGTGGHAWVYQGHDPFLEHDVAIKVLHRPGGATEDMLRRGRAEAKLLYRLKHKHIVEVMDAGITDSGLLYIVMELLQGRTLREILRTRGRLSVGEALALFSQMTDGVAAAHAANAIHRDLKPENIFVLHDNTPKVLDFGIAKVVDSVGFTTEKDVLHGTMLYMSPEQLDGQRATVRSDVYAFGLMMYEALCGTHPCLLRNPSPTIRELALIHKVKTAPWLDELDATIPRYVARVVDRAVTKLPEQRFGSMTELGAALRECQARHAVEPREQPSGPGALGSRSVPGGHDTERMEVQDFSSGTQKTPMKSAPGFAHRTRTMPPDGSAALNTVKPVTTRSGALTEGVLPRAPTREQSLRRVLIGGAIAGTVAGATVSLVLVWNDRSAVSVEPSAAEQRAPATPRTTKPGPASTARAAPRSTSAVPRAAASTSTAAARLDKIAPAPGSTTPARTAAARPTPSANKKSEAKPSRTGAKPSVPRETRADRELWIQ